MVQGGMEGLMFIITLEDVYMLIGAATCAGALVVIGGGGFVASVIWTARWLVRQKGKGD